MKIFEQTYSGDAINGVDKQKIEGGNGSEVFGSYLFKNPKLTFLQIKIYPHHTIIILGPGDEIIIDIWGASEMTYRQTISAEGTIRISGNWSDLYQWIYHRESEDKNDQ